MNIKSFVICLIIPLATGALAGLLTRSSMDIYMLIDKPALAPPGIIFPFVWTILYILMGISSYMIYTSGAKQKDVDKALTVYVAQLVVNFIWPLIFFGLRNFLFSFIWILALWVLIIVMIYRFYKISRLAAYLQIPYLVWVTFAAYLNLAVYVMN